MKKHKIVVSITGHRAKDCLSKIAEIKKLKINEAALFLECLEKHDRDIVYIALKASGLKSIPLVHLRSDMSREEIRMLDEMYKVKYFTIHEDHFNIINHWRGFYKKLYLEMSTDNNVADNVKVEKIGGFCVDLAHYQKQSVLDNADYEYVYSRRNSPQLFVCNHLSGYDSTNNMDMHLIKSKKDFLYLEKLPRFVFGKLIAFEVNNSITRQVSLKSYIESLINKA